MVYGDVPAGLIDGATPVAPHVDYGRVKVEAERLLGAAARERGIAFAALRLPHVYGARDLMFTRLRNRVSVLPGLSADAYAHLHVSDAARVLIAVGEQGWTGTAPLGDGENASWDRFFATLRRYYPHHRVVRVPAPLAEAGAALAGPVLSVRPGPRLVTRDTVRSSSVRQPVQPGLVWEHLGLAPRYPAVELGVPAALDELVAYRWRHPVDDRLS
jgi:nucleoside-diphosphate-sugar epimerase